MGIKKFFKNAFHDMKESAKAQHEVDKANLAAVKAESKANFEEAKLSPKARTEKLNRERQESLLKAQERKAAAEERIQAAKKDK